MELQISYCVCAKVSAESILPRETRSRRKNSKAAVRIAEYIENQLKEDEMGEQLTMSQYGPFTGGK